MCKYKVTTCKNRKIHAEKERSLKISYTCMKRNLNRDTETEQWASGYTFLFAIAVLCGECSGSNTLLELQKLQNRAARILKKRAFDAPK